MTRLIAGFASVLVVAGLASADAPPAPRYKFEPGQETSYRSTSTFKYGEKQTAGELGSRTDWTVWVVRPNEDGSFRLVIRQEDASYQILGGKKHERPARSQLVYADVFPDGRILPNDTIQYQSHPGPIFPQLPKDAAEAARGWSWERDGDKIAAKPKKADKGFRFEAVTESPLDAIYLSSSKSTYTFDQGRIQTVETVSTQGYGFNGKRIGTTEWLGSKVLDATFAKLLAAEETRYFEGLNAYRKACRKAVQIPHEAGEEAVFRQAVRSRLAAALTQLKSVKVTHLVLKAGLEEQVKMHQQSAGSRAEDAVLRANVVGKAAEAFETTDIDGKPVKLADLKGKVVVLDFWYRGCGWCVKAMPQMNGLAEDFQGKPVAIFGMNTDEKEEDARFVIEKMGLKYPTLKAIGLPEKFGVRGFPTLIVIDQQGKVHDLHVGYTPTLREDVGRQIQALLEKK